MFVYIQYLYKGVEGKVFVEEWRESASTHPRNTRHLILLYLALSARGSLLAAGAQNLLAHHNEPVFIVGPRGVLGTYSLHRHFPDLRPLFNWKNKMKEVWSFWVGLKDSWFVAAAGYFEELIVLVVNLLGFIFFSVFTHYKV